MKRLVFAVGLFLAPPAFAADDVSPKQPTVEDLQKQVQDLKGEITFWQSAAKDYRARFEAEVAASVQLKAQATSEAQKRNNQTEGGRK